MINRRGLHGLIGLEGLRVAHRNLTNLYFEPISVESTKPCGWGAADAETGSHLGEYFWKLQFPSENYCTRVTPGHIPEQLCINFLCKSDRGSLKSCFTGMIAATRSVQELQGHPYGHLRGQSYVHPKSQPYVYLKDLRHKSWYVQP